MSLRTGLWLGFGAGAAILIASVIVTSHREVHDAERSAPLDVAKLTSPRQLHGDLTVWSWNIAAKGLQSLVPAFRQQHPQVNVNVQMTGANIQTRFLLSLASGTGAPEVMQLQGYEAPRYIATHRMTDLTAVAAKYQQSFAPMAWANCVYEGRVYAIPWDIGPCAVYYKPELFARYGIDAEKIETWDDFIEAGKTIVRASNGQTKMLPLSPGSLQQTYEMLLQQANGQVFDEQGRIAIDSAESRRVLELLRKMFDAGICANVTIFSSEWMAGLNDDRIATYPGAAWLGGTIRDTTGEYGARRAKWGVFRLPALDRGGLRTSNLGGSVLVIPEQCAHKEAAWAFIEYALCTREGQVAQYRKYNLFPALLPALDDPAFAESDPFFGGQRVGELFASGIRGIPVLNRTQDWVEADNYLSQSLSAWAVNHEDTSQALETLSHKLQRRLGRERSPLEVQP